VGTYEPLIELASGGMGVVSVARRVGDAGFERLVVIKRVHPHLSADPSFRKMIRDEAQLLSRVHDAHVVSILDVVETEDGELSLVLEYVESLSLSALMRAAEKIHERIPLPVAARIVSDALAGLHAAHEGVDENGNLLGLIHRDVSPQNIIVGFDGSSRLIDFGIAKATTPAGMKEDTTGGVIKGKVRYMSPEQVKNGLLDRRTDVFSAGIVLYEAITGERIVKADNDGDHVLGLLIGDIKSPREWIPDLSPELDAVVMKSLDRDRDDRYATAAEFAEALERAVAVAPTREVARYMTEHGGEMISDRRARLRGLGRSSITPPRSIPPPTSVATAPAPIRERRKRTGLIAFLIACVAGAVGLLAWRVTHETLAPTPTPIGSVAAANADPSTNLPMIVSSAVSSAAPSSSISSIAHPPTTHGGRHLKSHSGISCTPNYDVLPDGTHRFKPQCVE
jgi:eukaryotic-like serine/threonine-protein kinase